MKHFETKTTKSPLQAEIETRLQSILPEYPIEVDLERRSLHMGNDGAYLENSMDDFWRAYIQRPDSDGAKRFDEFARKAVQMGFETIWVYKSKSKYFDYDLIWHFPPPGYNKADL